ncbi:ATPase [Methylobacterium radiodurans]|uniref:ATPase n=1 Tax=Methylobacterium radiodurans TaxID=2202828 RepID=A0A2U8VSR3_9HYPH|nr:ATPase [Methylobacterium radiodurans]AWN36481.1 ATPase [Methylobacterium radiodurans]
MSEPARQYPPTDTGPRPASGPLRDWLAAMKAQVPASAENPAEPVRRGPRIEPARPEPGWSPRVVEGRGIRAEDPDLAELMAENLMLKAKLDLESDREDALKAKLAEEIRALRTHVREEVGLLENFRAERDRILAECDGLRAERDAAQAESARFEAERDASREECDLWRARAEALAQPLFQARR